MKYNVKFALALVWSLLVVWSLVKIYNNPTNGFNWIILCVEIFFAWSNFKQMKEYQKEIPVPIRIKRN